ncbi:MAG TPA: RAMP superfamily CRISPR-associated protein [Candidatus Brocadiaceae bacterium]|nr:RAMP superfamily CRISPR-associated protein [Candidatus Brocadiaceae bacterium]
MLKRKLCEATFQWKLKCEGPLLIRDERYANYKEGKKEDGFPDCLFMSRATEKEIKEKSRQCGNKPPVMPFYVPGTSIRGPFRAQSERIIRSLLPEGASHPYTACDPFDQVLGCSEQLKKEDGVTRKKYAAACPACKLFGCAGLASRIRFTDADIEKGYSSVYRDMIGIDRFTGGVSKGGGDGSGKGANMRFHVLENTTFTTTVTVTNFELWQMGLLAYVFRDFEEGLVPIGFGKTKGFGLVKGEITEITLSYPETPTRINHIGSLMSNEAERADYGIHLYEAPPFGNPPVQKNDGFSLYKTISVTNIPDFWAKTAPAFNGYVQELVRQAQEKTA